MTNPVQNSQLQFDKIEVGDRVRHVREAEALDVVSVEPHRIVGTRRVLITNQHEWDRDLRSLIPGDRVRSIPKQNVYVVLGQNSLGIVGERTVEITDPKGWMRVVTRDQIPENAKDIFRV